MPILCQNLQLIQKFVENRFFSTKELSPNVQDYKQRTAAALCATAVLWNVISIG